MIERFYGVLIPANPFAECRYRTLAVDLMREALDCNLLEFIYPHQVHPVLNDGVSYVMVGDEEARLKSPHQLNFRATLLFGYPYLLAGDMFLLRDSDDGLRSIGAPLLARFRKSIIQEGYYE